MNRIRNRINTNKGKEERDVGEPCFKGVKKKKEKSSLKRGVVSKKGCEGGCGGSNRRKNYEMTIRICPGKRGNDRGEGEAS